MTAYLSMPAEANGQGPTTDQVTFMGTIKADKIEWQADTARWMFKFPRSLVIDLLRDIRGWELDGFMKVFVSAESGGKMFWGDDKIRILEEGAGRGAQDTSELPGPPSTPPGQSKPKSPRR